MSRFRSWNRASGYVVSLQPACHPCSAMPETVDAKKLSAANPICTCKYLFLFRIMNYMHIPTENRLNLKEVAVRMYRK